MIRRRLPRLACLALLLCGGQAAAHPMPFITCRADLSGAESLVRLHLAVDHASNPLVADEAEARAALQDALHVLHGGKTTPLRDLAPLRIQSGGTWQGILPDSLLPPDDGQPHQILTAEWSWRPDSAEISFSVAKGSLHDVLLWQQPPGGGVRSVLLLGGDVSPVLRVPSGGTSWASWLGLACVALLLAALLARRQRRPQE